MVRISHLKDKFHRAGENIPHKELIIMTLRGFPSIWKTFITTSNNNNVLLKNDEITGKLTEGESILIARERIQKHEEGETTVYIFHGKRNNKIGCS